MLVTRRLFHSGKILRGEHKATAWGPIHFYGINWKGTGAVPFSTRNKTAFSIVFWTLSAIGLAFPFIGVEKKLWPQRVANWEKEKQ